MIIEGNLVDVKKEEIYPAKIVFDKKILEIEKINRKCKNYILPGLIDAHIHIESSMLTPSRFAEIAVKHGTTAVITDPHEIANVLGLDGIKYMINDSKNSPLKIYFTAPSCVPATAFETSGSILDSKKIEDLMKMKEVVALGEVMNYPGVINEDKEILKKIRVAKKYKKPIDGHAPKLSGEDLKKYVSFGISTDHECTTYEEALEKAKLGMKIMIREGSSSKDMKNLIKIADGAECFFVSDDLHADDLLKGHINLLLKKAVSFGLDPIKAIKCVTLNPAEHYKIDTGFLEIGRSADLIEVCDLKNFSVKRVFIDGKLVSKNGKSLFKVKPKKMKNTIRSGIKTEKDFLIFSENKKENVRVIGVIDKSLITKNLSAELKVFDGKILCDLKNDILKIAVVERYGHNRVANGFIKGFSLKNGAIASSVAHDSHNIVVVGTNERYMKNCVNEIIKMNGGLIATDGKKFVKVELPVAGLMSLKNAESVSKDVKRINNFVKKLGCELRSPFGTLSFMSLLVIPELKISDQGLFDVNDFKFVNVIIK